MRATTLTGFLLLALGALASCGDDDGSDAGPSAGSPSATGGRAGSPSSGAGEGGAGAANGGAGGGGEPGLVPCLDRPDDLPSPPLGRLPCGLLPPGFPTGERP